MLLDSLAGGLEISRNVNIKEVDIEKVNIDPWLRLPTWHQSQQVQVNFTVPLF